jgi:hypothetical protein
VQVAASKARIGLAAVALLLLVLLLLAGLWAWRTLGSRPATVPFLELLYQQSFAPLPEADPYLPLRHPEDGYWFRSAERRLYPAMDRPMERSPRFLLGLGVQFLYDLQDVSSVHALRSFGQRSGSWNVADGRDFERVAGLHPLSWFRLGPQVEASYSGDVCEVAVEGERASLEPGERRVVWTGSQSLAYADFLKELEAVNPELEEPTGSDREVVRRILRMEADDRVTIHGRILATCHGEVEFINTDLVMLAKQIRIHMDRGQFAQAAAALETHLSILPDDRDARDLLSRLRSRGEETEGFRRLHGRVELPPGQEPDGPVFVMVRRSEDPPHLIRKQARVQGGEYEIFLPAGEYEVLCSVEGFRPQTRTVDLSVSDEADFAFSAADRL